MKRSGRWKTSTPTDAVTDDRLERLWDAVRRDDYARTRPAVETWIREVHARQIEERSKAAWWRTYGQAVVGHPLRIVYAVAGLVVLIAACNIQITQEETIGYLVLWEVDRTPEAARRLLERVPELDASRLSISTDANRGHTTLILPVLGPGGEDIQRWIRHLGALEEVISTRVYPFKETVKRPAYAAALRIVQIDVGSERLSEAEVQRRIEAQLRAQGMPEADVTYQRLPDGRSAIEVAPDSNEASENP